MIGERRLSCIGAMCVALLAPVAAAQPVAPQAPGLLVEETVDILNESIASGASLDSRLRHPVPYTPPTRPRRRLRLDVGPLLTEFIRIARGVGLPISPIEDASKRKLVGISATFRLREDWPALNFHARERSPELFGAFYPTVRGVDAALVWPIAGFTLRIEGGDDSEFGYFAIAGAQWQHPTRPLAIGVGVPMNLRNARGEVGGVVLLRFKLD